MWDRERRGGGSDGRGESRGGRGTEEWVVSGKQPGEKRAWRKEKEPSLFLFLPPQPIGAAFSSVNAPKSPLLSTPAFITVIITSVPAPSPPSPGVGVTGADAPPLPRKLLVTRMRLFITWAQRAWESRPLGMAGGGGAHCWPLWPASRRHLWTHQARSPPAPRPPRPLGTPSMLTDECGCTGGHWLGQTGWNEEQGLGTPKGAAERGRASWSPFFLLSSSLPFLPSPFFSSLIGSALLYYHYYYYFLKLTF